MNCQKNGSCPAHLFLERGNAATLPQRFYIYDGVLTQEYSRINEYRLPSYHRLDLGCDIYPKQTSATKIKK